MNIEVPLLFLYIFPIDFHSPWAQGGAEEQGTIKKQIHIDKGRSLTWQVIYLSQKDGGYQAQELCILNFITGEDQIVARWHLSQDGST